MGKVLKIFGIFIIVISIALASIWTAEKISPGFREDVEMFLKIDDENAISTLKDKNAKLEEQISGYENRIETLKLQILDLETTVEELGIEDEFLRSEIQRLQARVNELEQQVENLDGNIDNLNAQIEAMNKEVDELWNIFNNLGEYENAVNNGTSVNTQLTESEKALLESKIAELEETVSELTDEIEELNDTISDLTNQIANLENQKADIEINKTNNDILIVDKTKSIDNYNTYISNYNIEIGNLDQSIHENNININALLKKQEDSELSEAEAAQLTELQNQNTNLEAQKYDINANLKECEERVATLQTEVAELERNNAEYERQIVSIDNQITELETQVTALESEASDVQSNINSLQDKINKFNGLIGNSTIINGNGDVVQEPSNPVNPETPVTPPESEDLTLNIQGESALNLPLENLQSDEAIMNYFENNENFDDFMYSPIDEAGSEFENFVNGENCYMAFTIDDTIQFLMILYSDTESARGVFASFEAIKEELVSERLELNCIAQCGKVGFIEFTRLNSENPEQPEQPPVVEDLTVTMTGTPIFEIPYSELQTLAEVENYLTNNGYYFDTISAGNENMDSGMLSVFVGANHFVTAMLNNERQILGIVIYDNIDNARGIFESANVMISNMGDGVELVNSVHCGLIGVIEMQHKVCEHNGETYTDKIYVSETETQITYNVITKCSKCGDGLSSEMVTEDKETTICEHTETYVVQENYKESETMISYDNVTYCKKCDAEISRETITEQKAVCNHSGFSLRQEYLREDENYTYYNNIYICDNCGIEISREEVAIEKPCEHNGETYTTQEYSSEDANYIHYTLITYCSKCNVELSRDSYSEEKPSQEPQLLFANNEEELVSALANAKDGDSIFVKDYITVNNPIVIDKSITIYGYGLSGSSVYVTAENVSIQGISFSGLKTENEIQESYIYAKNYGGSLSITNCTFSGSEWDSIQITPVSGANITISDCNFMYGDGETKAQRYIHIEAEKDEIADCVINISNNRFQSIEKLNTTNGNGEAIGIYYCNLEQIYVSDNVFNGNLSVEELQAKVCIANESPWTASESMLLNNTFTSTLAQ